MARSDLEATKLLEDVQRLAGMGFWEFDVPNNQVTWSDELYRIYGLEPQEFEATYEAFLERIHPDDREMVDQTVQRAFETQDAWAFDHRLVRPDGSVRWLHGRGHVDVQDGQIVRMVGTAMDVTDRKRTEERLRTFVANASHEMRTPVTAMVHAIGLLRKDDRDETRSTVFDILERNVARLQSLTKNLLDLSSMDAGARTIMIGPVDLSTAVGAAAQASEEGEVGIDVPEGLTVAAEADALVTVLANLVSNAFRHGAPPVRISGRVDGDEVVIAVEDSGSGVPEADRADLFTAFVASQETGGTGLGLPMVRSLARSMGGTADYAPTADRPGRFVVRLKAAE